MHIVRPEDNIASTNSAGTSSGVGKELASSIQDVIKSELKLAKIEASEAAGKAGKDLAKIVAFGVFAALGIFPFMAFLVVGLGDLLDNYWLSSLLVAIAMFAIGGLAARSYAKKMKEHDLSLPHTRDSLKTHKPVIDRALSNIKSQFSHVTQRVKDIPRKTKEELTTRRPA